MTVTTDVTLTRNLTCAGPGLTVGADNVTIKLDGHTLTGTGAGTSTDIGISATGRADLRITGGRITGFRQAILLSEVRNGVLHDLRLTGNPLKPPPDRGTLGITASQHIQILESQIAQPATGNALSIDSTASVRMERLRGGGNVFGIGVSDVSLSRSTFADAQLIFMSSRDIKVRQNTLRRSNVVAFDLTGLAIVDNRFTGSIGWAINLEMVDDAVIEQNSISGTRDGIAFSGNVWDTRIAHNLFAGNDYGVRLTGSYLVGVDPLIADNVFTRNRKAGILLVAGEPTGAPSTMVITRNIFVRNGYGSTEADTSADGRTINDGIYTDLPIGSLPTISANKTYFNADHGIEALPAGSVRDGGGNQSTGDPNGCAGVVCG